MKFVIIVFNSSIEERVIDAVKECGIEEYTRIPTVYGVGKNSGPHMGTHIWPATNSLLIISCDDESSKRLMEKMKELKEHYLRLGLKAFVLNEEETV